MNRTTNTDKDITRSTDRILDEARALLSSSNGDYTVQESLCVIGRLMRCQEYSDRSNLLSEIISRTESIYRPELFRLELTSEELRNRLSSLDLTVAQIQQPNEAEEDWLDNMAMILFCSWDRDDCRLAVADELNLETPVDLCEEDYRRGCLSERFGCGLVRAGWLAIDMEANFSDKDYLEYPCLVSTMPKFWHLRELLDQSLGYEPACANDNDGYSSLW